MPTDTVEDMVERISWLSPVHYEVLNFFEAHDITVSPAVLAANTGYDRQYLSKRCGDLVDAGILAKPNEGLYELSDLGRDFIAGKVDAEVIEDATDE